MELKTSELRIGNKMFLLGKVVSVTPMLIVEQAQSNLACQEYLQPIPLNEEWLVKFGFRFEKGDSENDWYFLEYRNFVFFSDTSCDYLKVFIWLVGKEIEINTVHQLQNLYFALTNQELTINQ